MQDINQKSISAEASGTTHSLPSRLTRRAFMAGAVASAAMVPGFLRAAIYGRAEWALLHLATRTSQSGHLHTFALAGEDCRFLGSTAIDSFAAFAAHPVLPVLYVARDCNQWDNLPRGLVETYASATRFDSAATSSRGTYGALCHRSTIACCRPRASHLLVSASTGGAWNAFSLDDDGIPESVAMSRKETGHVTSSGTSHFQLRMD